MSNELTPLSAAHKALVEAQTFDDFKNVRDAATAAQSWVKARKGGIEIENDASVYILRAERGAGRELIRMAEEGERRTGGRKVTSGRGLAQKPSPNEPVPVVYDDLGISRTQGQHWQAVARLSEETFDAMIAEARAAKERIAKINFYTAERKPKAVVQDRSRTKESEGFTLFREGAMLLLGWSVDQDGIGAPTKNNLLDLPVDELGQVAVMIKALVAAYQEARAARG